MKPGASSTGSRTEVCAFCDDDENHLNDSTWIETSHSKRHFIFSRLLIINVGVVVQSNVMYFWPRVKFALCPGSSTWSPRVIAHKGLWVQDPGDMRMNMSNPRLSCVNWRLGYRQFIADFALLDLLLFLISILTLIVCLPRSSHSLHYYDCSLIPLVLSIYGCIRLRMNSEKLHFGRLPPLEYWYIFNLSGQELIFQIGCGETGVLFKAYFDPNKREGGGGGGFGGDIQRQIDGQGGRNTFLIGSQTLLVSRIEWYVGEWVRLIWTDNVCKWHGLQGNGRSS